MSLSGKYDVVCVVGGTSKQTPTDFRLSVVDTAGVVYQKLTYERVDEMVQVKISVLLTRK